MNYTVAGLRFRLPDGLITGPFARTLALFVDRRGEDSLLAPAAAVVPAMPVSGRPETNLAPAPADELTQTGSDRTEAASTPGDISAGESSATGSDKSDAGPAHLVPPIGEPSTPFSTRPEATPATVAASYAELTATGSDRPETPYTSVAAPTGESTAAGSDIRPEVASTGQIIPAGESTAAGSSRPEADLILEYDATPGLYRQEENYRELYTFDFEDADAACRFGHDDAGYLFVMAPSDGSTPASFRTPHLLEGPFTARCNYRPEHDPNLLRFGLWMLYNLAAVHRGAVAIHSSVVCYRGRAVLVLGESGTGKSTHTRLWREHIPGTTLLNDDSPIVGTEDGMIVAHGSPWSGKTPCYKRESYPVQGIVRLSQAPRNRIRRLTTLEAIGALLPSCPPAFARDERLSDAVCDLVSHIVARVPVCHLECLPDADAARLSFRTLFADETADGR